MKSRAPFRGSISAPGFRAATGLAFSLVELLVVIAVISILMALTFPVLNRVMAKSRQIQCLNQLRQTGIASQTFAQEHNDRLPVQLWTNGCSVTNHRHEIVVSNALVRSSCAFLAMSNELANPQLLVCRADKRIPALNFRELRDENVSYLVGLQGNLNQPGTILALDGNVFNLASNTPVDPIQGGTYQFAWTQVGHGRKGNVLYADGHVELRKNANVTVAPIPQPTPESVSPEPGSSDTTADSSGNYSGATGGAAGLATATRPGSTSPTAVSPSLSPTPTTSPTAITTNTQPSRVTTGGIPSTNQPSTQIQIQPGTSLSTPAGPKPASLPTSIEPESLPQPKFEPAAPNSSSAVGPGGGGGPGNDDYDSDNYRRFVFGVKIIYLLLVLWAVGVVILYILKYWWARRGQ